MKRKIVFVFLCLTTCLTTNAQIKLPRLVRDSMVLQRNMQGPQDDLPAGSWKSANPENVLEFSAVAYFFARDLYEKYHIPIGIINASVGGTPIEAWTSEEGFRDFPSILKTIERNKDTAYINGFSRRRPQNIPEKPGPMDKGLAGPTPWYNPGYMPKGWRPICIPGYWAERRLRS
jgi:sialate O-acetylesterase